MDRPQCSRCRAYRMTWESEQPHACSAFGFKSAALPSRVVEASSGQPCAYFEPRPQPRGKTEVSRVTPPNRS